MLEKMPVKLFIFLILICLQETLSSQTEAPVDNRLSLLFIGDIMGHDSQIWSAENLEAGTYDYNDVFVYIKSLISDADIAIANFEVTLAGPPYKGYPLFSSPAALAVACGNAGIDILATANNHAADRGKDGIEGTINRLDSLGILHTGTFLNMRSKDSLNPLMIYKSGFSIALLNYTYGTNGISVPDPLIVNMLNRNQICADIDKARNRDPDMIVLFLHWGNEYDTIPSKSQLELADYLFLKGADLIIGSHPHVLQKMVWLKSDTTFSDRIVVYSLGNFVSNQRKPKTDGGSMVKVDLVRSGNSVSVACAGYYLTWVYTPIISYEKKFYILPCSEFEKKPDFFPVKTDYLQMMKFINDSRSLLYKHNLNIKEYVFDGRYWLLNE
jgi:poly-gamma-glutamate capsule biosynthesis protein CapA/YwtB (metallophosphatase superfamily)